ncbi:unnamed protein product [Trichogramma brassicae]|uniref:Endonuclease/exonuclease/phosphatase domain-containing protein n=1 Tax=Trichogramma brassicae TaxID=86971 RepID=A0A6H5IHY5_9HYME|nr:unnamed protein product [Trichogramma brassicae]
MTKILGVSRQDKVLIAIDANVCSDLWFSKPSARSRDNRERAEELANWIGEKAMDILNAPTVAYTFSGAHGRSDIDVTLAKGWNAMQVLTGSPPWDLKCRMRRTLYKLEKDKQLDENDLVTEAEVENSTIDRLKKLCQVRMHEEWQRGWEAEEHSGVTRRFIGDVQFVGRSRRFEFSLRVGFIRTGHGSLNEWLSERRVVDDPMCVGGSMSPGLLCHNPVERGGKFSVRCCKEAFDAVSGRLENIKQDVIKFAMENALLKSRIRQLDGQLKAAQSRPKSFAEVAQKKVVHKERSKTVTAAQAAGQSSKPKPTRTCKRSPKRERFRGQGQSHQCPMGQNGREDKGGAIQGGRSGQRQHRVRRHYKDEGLRYCRGPEKCKLG